MTTMNGRGVDEIHGYAPLRPVAGAAAPDASPVVSGGVSQAALDAAQAFSDAHDGVALLVWSGGALRHEAYAPHLTQDSLFETFSMHKSALGLLYGAAIRDGAIASIDDPVGLYIAEWRDDPRGAIPLRHLLGMSSGLTIHSLDKGDPVALALMLGDRISETALSVQAQRPSGEVFDYYNVAAQVAGLALSRAVAAKGLGDAAAYLSKALWAPMGGADARLWVEREDGEPRFFAGLQARARDWLQLGRLVAGAGALDGRQVLPADWIAAITAENPLNPAYGLLVWRAAPVADGRRTYGPSTAYAAPHGAPFIADDLVYFDGFGGQRVYVSPSRDLVIVRIGRPRLDFDDAVLPNLIVEGLQ
ncbi:serine hydrolase [Caulobacter sp. CCNWLW153]|uniref:serine hydrolase domain-containing protein n=2 Tax=Caulobacter TaxID=75 RepID=UPI0030A28B55